MKKMLMASAMALTTVFASFVSTASAENTRLTTISTRFYNESQLIVVAGKGYLNKEATVETYERVKGVWRKAFPDMPAVVGYEGFTLYTAITPGRTPTGVFKIGTGFGAALPNEVMHFPYQKTDSYDYWVKDSSSPDYNQWVRYTGNPATKWKSFERLNLPTYKYAATLNFNQNPVVKGRGSGIFMHTWKSPTTATSGSVAVSEENMKLLLNWMDSFKRPHIVMAESGVVEHQLLTRREKLVEVSVKVNGELQTFDQPAVIIDNRTMAPFREIGELLGAKVEWDNTTKTVTAYKGDKKIELPLFSNVAKINGQELTMETATMNINLRVMVPIRFFAQALDAEVDWDMDNRVVLINN